jgi:hypothetical protein
MTPFCSVNDEAYEGHDRILGRYLKPDVLMLDEMGMKQLPKRSGEWLLEITLRRHEVRSTLMTSNRPLGDCWKLIGDASSATAILDRLLENSEVTQITGKSYRLRGPQVRDRELGSANRKTQADARGGTNCKQARGAPGNGGAETSPDPSNHHPFSQQSPGWFWGAPGWPVLRRPLTVEKPWPESA